MQCRCTVAVVGLICTSIAACGSQSRRPLTPSSAARSASSTVGCAEGGSNPSPLGSGWKATSVVSGPLTLACIKQYADQPAAAFAPAREALGLLASDPGSGHQRRAAQRTLQQTPRGSYAVSEAVVRVAAGSQATLAVASAQRSSVALIYGRRARNQDRPGAPGAYRVADGDPSVTFRACPQADTDFLGGIVVAGPRCLAMTVTSPGRRSAHLRLAFGKDSCAAATRLADRGQGYLRRDPQLGVACSKANSIACDRVGVGVWLKQPAKRVTATINGRALLLHAGGLGGRGPRYWEGYLKPAGLIRGPLKVTPDRGRYYWQGTHPKDARVLIAIRRADGSTDRSSVTVALAAGWG